MAIIRRPKEKINFRKLKEGSLVRFVEGGQPMVFEGIEKTQGGADDYVKLICLDPAEGLCRREYYLRKEESFLRKKVLFSEKGIDSKSKEGRKYLELITGK